MNAFRNYRDWLTRSNEAGIFREAFEINDRMPMELRGDVFQVIFLRSEAAWASYRKDRNHDGA